MTVLDMLRHKLHLREEINTLRRQLARLDAQIDAAARRQHRAAKTAHGGTR